MDTYAALPPDPRRAFAELGRRVGVLERRVDPDKANPPRRPRLPIITVAASDTDELLAASATYHCDGTADQIKVQEAVDSIASSGLGYGTVILLPGQFSFTDRVSVNSTHVTGRGAVITAGGSGAFALEGTSAELSDLTIIYNGLGDAIYVLGNYVSINRCEIYGRIRVQGTGNKIFGNLVSVTSDGFSAIHLDVATECMIFGNWLRANAAGASGMYVESASARNVIASNVIGPTGAHGIWLDGTNLTVADNTIVGNMIYSASNISPGNAHDGIILLAADRTNIQANTIRPQGSAPNTRYGINISNANCNDNLVANNDLFGTFGTDDYNDAGTDTRGTGGISGGGAHPDLATHDALGLATDAEVATAVTDHVTADHTGLATDTEVATAVSDHAAAADPHAGYQKESEKGAASGYAGLDAEAQVPTAQLATGTADTTTFLRGDQTWAVPIAGSGSDGLVPYYLTVGETFTVPEYRQALFVEPIELDGGTLDVEGLLIEVTQPPDLSALVHMSGV